MTDIQNTDEAPLVDTNDDVQLSTDTNDALPLQPQGSDEEPEAPEAPKSPTKKTSSRRKAKQEPEPPSVTQVPEEIIKRKKRVMTDKQKAALEMGRQMLKELRTKNKAVVSVQNNVNSSDDKPTQRIPDDTPISGSKIIWG